MDVLAAHRSGLRQFSERVQLVRDDQWHNSTPDTEWDVADLVAHLIREQLRVPRLLAGETSALIGDSLEGDEPGPDPKAAWTAAATAARAAVEAPGVLDRMVHLSFADVPAPEYLWQLTRNLVVHAWDLARGIKAEEQMPNDLLSAVLDEAKRTAPDWSDSGHFDPPIPVPGCTDDLTELLALTGRQRW